MVNPTKSPRLLVNPTKSPFVHGKTKLDDGWPESEKDVFQAALSMVVVKDSR